MDQALREVDVTPAQSAASGLPVYSTGGGFTSWGMGGQARYDWSPQWATYVYVEYQRLVGDVANAPIVAIRGSRDQVEGGGTRTAAKGTRAWHPG